MARHWHSCARFGRFGMQCPFVGEVDHDKDDPDFKEPVRVPKPSKPTPVLAMAEKAKKGTDAAKAALLAEAEDIVTRAADAIPSGVSGRSLADELRRRGPVAVGLGAAAGIAIRAVSKGFAGGGFHFPQVFDPLKAVRVR